MNQLMTPQQVGAEYGVTVQELAEWRRKKIGPAYYVLGTRVIRYMPKHVDQWFRSPMVIPEGKVMPRRRITDLSPLSPNPRAIGVQETSSPQPRIRAIGWPLR